jgi:small-conductance mechanosensitive channel
MDFSSIQTIYYQFGVTAVGIILFFAGKYFIKKIVKNHAVKHKFDTRRITYTVKFFNICWAIIILSIIAITWNVSFRGLSLYFASIFTVIGVAFFAQWSILSKVTASIILFFNYSYKIGNKIKIIDGENSVTGIVIDIDLFQLRIKIDSGEIVTYPNNLIVQKPSMLLNEKELDLFESIEVDDLK